jgi:hypothetical protein
MRSTSRLVGGLWSLVIALLLIASGAGMAATISQPSTTKAHTHTSAATGGSALAPVTIAMSGTLSSTKACGAGFTRVGPNLCMRTDTPSLGNITTSCTSITIPAGDAQTLGIQYSLQVNGANAAGATRSEALQFFTDSSCINSDAFYQALVFEFAAVNNGAILNYSATTQLPVFGGGHWVKSINGGGASSSAALQVRWYTD